jgi:hypothetical protein
MLIKKKKFSGVFYLFEGFLPQELLIESDDIPESDTEA